MIEQWCAECGWVPAPLFAQACPMCGASFTREITNGQDRPINRPEPPAKGGV